MRSILIGSFLVFSSLQAVEPVQTYAAKDYRYLIGMPGFNDSLLEMHFKLYEGYVKNTNDLLAKLKVIQGSTYDYGALKRRLGWEFDGMRLHELYFDNLRGSGILDLKTPLSAAINAQFGGYEQWKKDFIATGSMRGIGWAILYYDSQSKRFINAWINEHDTGHLAYGTPLLIMDVFEHAYITQFGLDRAAYIAAFFANINWAVVNDRYMQAVGTVIETNPSAIQK